jgi:hypothetical protein
MWNTYLLYPLHENLMLEGPMLATTLSDIRNHSPDKDMWRRLLKGLGVKRHNTKPLPLERILEINGLEGALWALRAVKGHDGAIRLFVCYCAKYSLDIFERELPDDTRPRQAIETAERFARGQATDDELAAAEAAAEAAARGAALAAALHGPWLGVWAVARAARAAAWAAAQDARWAARDAARDAVEAAEVDVVWNVSASWEEMLEAVLDATSDAAAEEVAAAAYAPVRAAAWADLEREFIRLCRYEGEYAVFQKA